MFTIIITACYTGSIIAFVTLPVFPETVDTVKQLLNGRYQIGTLGNLLFKKMQLLTQCFIRQGRMDALVRKHFRP